MIPGDREKIKVKLALGLPITFINKITDIPPVIALKIIIFLSI